MQLHRSLKNFGLIALIMVAGVNAWSCPEHIKNFKTRYLKPLDICKAHDRYQKALEKLRERGIVNPERIGNLMAPRFISLNDWTSKKTSSPNSALLIYKPAPTTWTAWEDGARIIDQSAKYNLYHQKIPALTFEFLHQVHVEAMKARPEVGGVFRKGGEIGLSVYRAQALTESQVAGIRSVEFKSAFNPEQNIVGFSPTECFEEKDPATRDSLMANLRYTGFDTRKWVHRGKDEFFTADDGKKKQCGYITYAAQHEIAPQMKAWFDSINSTTATWSTKEPSGDPVLVAARAQRWFIAIHPYTDGNGRISRYVMDLLLQSVGLPAPIIKDTNQDMYVTERQWAIQVGVGVLRAIVEAEKCVKKPETVGCIEIATVAANQAAQNTQATQATAIGGLK